jgi:fermentation-respiration switch protein FrsA (DUF1100 family)
MRTDVDYDSDGVTIAGWLYPAETAGDGPHPAVIMSSGYAGVRGGLHGYGYPQAFAAAGFTTLLFDNPHLGASGGEPRQELDPLRQQRAYRDGVTYLASRSDVDAERIGIWGTSYSGGHVLVVGANDRRVKVVVSQAMTISGHANTLRRHSPAEYAALARRFADDRLGRARGEAPVMVEAFSTESDTYRKTMARDPADRDGWVNEITLRSLEMYDEYEPGMWVARVSPRPLLMIVPTGDRLTPAEDALEAYNRALEPKRLVMVPGDHYAVYEEQFETTSTAAIDWFRAHL